MIREYFKSHKKKPDGIYNILSLQVSVAVCKSVLWIAFTGMQHVRAPSNDYVQQEAALLIQNALLYYCLITLEQDFRRESL